MSTKVILFSCKSRLLSVTVLFAFQSLTVGLLHNKPDDPLNFVQDCLHSVQGQKPSEIRWNSFQDKVQTKSDETSPKTGTDTFFSVFRCFYFSPFVRSLLEVLKGFKKG